MPWGVRSTAPRALDTSSAMPASPACDRGAWSNANAVSADIVAATKTARRTVDRNRNACLSEASLNKKPPRDMPDAVPGGTRALRRGFQPKPPSRDQQHPARRSAGTLGKITPCLLRHTAAAGNPASVLDFRLENKLRPGINMASRRARATPARTRRQTLADTAQRKACPCGDATRSRIGRDPRTPLVDAMNHAWAWHPQRGKTGRAPGTSASKPFAKIRSAHGPNGTHSGPALLQTIESCAWQPAPLHPGGQSLAVVSRTATR